MIHKLWQTCKAHTHITSQTQVVVVPLGEAIAAAAACICGVSPFNPYITAISGSGKTISPCGVLPLVSPGLHNPVKRNEQ